jgi:hypothetical protein
LEEFLSDLATELVEDVRKEEEDYFNESCLQHVANIVDEVTMEDCMNMVKDIMRKER